MTFQYTSPVTSHSAVGVVRPSMCVLDDSTLGTTETIILTLGVGEVYAVAPSKRTQKSLHRVANFRPPSHEEILRESCGA